MNIDTQKIELIDWIAKLQDQQIIESILHLKERSASRQERKKKVFGSGKDIVEYLSEDFNDPLEEFKNYEK